MNEKSGDGNSILLITRGSPTAQVTREWAMTLAHLSTSGKKQQTKDLKAKLMSPIYNIMDRWGVDEEFIIESMTWIASP